MTNAPIVIAIDGTAASGKGTLARKLAEKLDFAYLDTGKLYRYIGYALVIADENPEDERCAVAAANDLKDNLKPEELQNPALTSDEAGQAASKVAAIPAVRAVLLNYQKTFANSPPNNKKGAILDGRDIGTIVCPDANLKFYVDAAIEIRADRRHKELQSKDISVTYDAVLADMRERDKRDSERETSPMKPADDAIILDTSEMGINDVLEKAESLIKDKLSI